MGAVYRARDVLLNRFAALKFLPDAGLDDARKGRFLHGLAERRPLQAAR